MVQQAQRLATATAIGIQEPGTAANSKVVGGERATCCHGPVCHLLCGLSAATAPDLCVAAKLGQWRAVVIMTGMTGNPSPPPAQALLGNMLRQSMVALTHSRAASAQAG